MRSALVLAGAAAIAALSLVTSVKTSEAQVIYPWCAHYGRTLGGAPSCGFVTFAQCMAAISGNGGFCDVNPWWQGPPPEQSDPRVYRRIQRY